jgi:hypothetical protein
MKWTDHESNPLISPPKRKLFRIIGDPTVLNPGETPEWIGATSGSSQRPISIIGGWRLSAEP